MPSPRVTVRAIRVKAQATPVNTVRASTSVIRVTAKSTVAGPRGLTGPANTLTIGEVTTGATGTPAAAGITGNAPTQTLNLTLPKGDVGSEWHTDAGVPDSELGLDEDFYLNNVTGDVYEKQSGTWALVANIRGPQGVPGDMAGPDSSTNNYVVKFVGTSGKEVGQGTAYFDASGYLVVDKLFFINAPLGQNPEFDFQENGTTKAKTYYDVANQRLVFQNNENNNPDAIYFADAATFALDVAVAGDLSAANLSGTNTGDQDLSGLMPKSSVAANGMGVVVHGATAGTARPTGFAQITWIGTVEPTNATTNDIWYNG